MSNNQLYIPRSCAFHPKQLIFNFCKNADCLLPLCPSCVKVHSEEHKLESSYGEFENMERLVESIDSFLGDVSKELNGCTQEMIQSNANRVKVQQDIKRKMTQAKNKMMGLVQRFFTDFQKEVTKSIISYNESMKQNNGKITLQIKQLNQEIQAKRSCLGTDKVLKTVISYYSKDEQDKLKNTLQTLKDKIMELQERRVDVVCQPSCAQRIIDELGQYIHLSFQNWQNEIKYVAEFVKTGFSDKMKSTITQQSN